MTSQECEICFMEYPQNEFINLFCDHKYCKTCLRHILKIKIEEKNVRKIICPHDECKEEISFEKIKEILTTEMFEKYDSALLGNVFINDRECIFCPVPDCGNPIYGDKNSPKIICRKCDQKICYNCKTVGWHKGDCDVEEKKDDGVAEWMKKTGSKPCPKCSVPIEKNKGCDHVYCINCKHHFYWSKPETEYTGKKYIPLTETQWNENAVEWNLQHPGAINNPWNIAHEVPNLHWGDEVQQRIEVPEQTRVRREREIQEYDQQMYGVHGGETRHNGIWCTHCNRIYNADIGSWKKHCETKKHQRNAANNGNN